MPPRKRKAEAEVGDAAVPKRTISPIVATLTEILLRNPSPAVINEAGSSNNITCFHCNEICTNAYTCSIRGCSAQYHHECLIPAVDAFMALHPNWKDQHISFCPKCSEAQWRLATIIAQQISESDPTRLQVERGRGFRIRVHLTSKAQIDDKAEEHLRKLFQSSENLSGNEWEEEASFLARLFL